jgi:hypothetical protein
MNFEFSFVALLLLIMLFVPNILWSRYPPKDYEKYSKNENKLFLTLERLGEILVTVFSLFCGVKFSSNPILIIIFASMILYELYWIRYFRSPKTMQDMFSSFLGIPLAGATLPVFAFLLLGILARNIPLVISAIILGIGHIAIHYEHKLEAE